jgi:hypothetical protein
VVVNNCHNADLIREECTKKIEEYALRGFRGLGVAVAAGDGSADEGGKPKWELVGELRLAARWLLRLAARYRSAARCQGRRKDAASRPPLRLQPAEA